MRGLILLIAGILTLSLLGGFQHQENQIIKTEETPDTWPEANIEDVKSIDAIMTALYSLESGPKGQARDWSRIQALYLPEARLIAARPQADGGCKAVIIPITEYIAKESKYIEKAGYFSKEIFRSVEQFGNMAQVMSTYEVRRNDTDEQYFSRTLNSIQLMRDGDRWWIVNIFWDFERPNNLIPDKYLPAKTEG